MGTIWNDKCPNCDVLIRDIWAIIGAGRKFNCPNCGEALHVTSVGRSLYGLGLESEIVSETYRRFWGIKGA